VKARYFCLLLLLAAPVSRAEVIVEGASLLDTATNLRWTRVRMPTSTFIPEVGGLTIADLGDYFTLMGDMTPPTSAYSAATALAVDWFVEPFSFVYGGPGYPEGAACAGPYGGGNCFAGASASYGLNGNGDWQLIYAPTLSLYGPTFALPVGGDHWDVDSVYAFAIEPVPIPAAAVLLTSALGLLVGIQKRRVRPQ
jgi:hypothetical protein